VARIESAAFQVFDQLGDGRHCFRRFLLTAPNPGA
jgi:hypothetical protein